MQRDGGEEIAVRCCSGGKVFIVDGGRWRATAALNIKTFCPRREKPKQLRDLISESFPVLPYIALILDNFCSKQKLPSGGVFFKLTL